MKPKKHSEGLSAMILVSMISGELACSILFGVFCGNLLDELLKVEPIFLVLGILSGLVLGVYSVKTTLDWFYNQENRKNE